MESYEEIVMQAVSQLMVKAMSEQRAANAKRINLKYNRIKGEIRGLTELVGSRIFYAEENLNTYRASTETVRSRRRLIMYGN